MALHLFKIFLFCFFVLAAPAHGATTVTANITGNTTWTEAGSPYVVGDSHAITAGATLTIEPGVVVKFGYNCAQFYVAGGAAINAIGTAEKPIYFTSISDDTVGGDTNGDGSATIPSEASWIHMFFDAGSSGNFDHAVIRYAGGSNCQYKSNSALYNAGGGTLTVSNSEFYKNVAGMRMLAGTANVSNSDFHDQGSGILLQGGNASVSNSNFHNHIGSGIEANKGVLNLTENSFTDNLRSAARISGAVDFAHSRNTASNNGYDAFEIYSIISNDQAWNKDLVYVLSDITVAAGKTLSVGPGVIMKMRTVSDQFMVIGRLLAQGTADEKIYFTSIADDTVGGDTNGDGSATSPKAGDWVHIFFLNTGSTGELSNAVIRYAGSRFYWNHTYAGIASFADSLSLSETELTDNSIYGIIHREGALNVANSEIARHSETGIRSFGGEVNVSNSSLHDNQSYGINNSGPNIALAENNWWGDQSGPYHPILNPSGLGNRVSNNVDFDPWLGYDPTKTLPPPEFEECCSSVLFLPGLEASRLYGADGKRLWEPEIDHDNSRLFLNPDGTSIEPNIYTEDIIDEALLPIAGSNIYKSFEESMYQLESEGVIDGFQSYPYDWRLDINDIVNNYTRLNFGLASLIPTLEALAQNSQTGKVTIIAHSNGGLVGKLLINELERRGKADLVDKFIMVAVPQLGTPKAITAMLHGEDLPSTLPFIMKASTARTLTENMASGYTLLPSNEYFNRVLDPVVEFDFTSPLAQIYRDRYGVAITNSSELHDFLLGAEGRAKPSSSDVISPNILNETLLDRGAANHIALDSWSAPENIEVIQIAGWGINTIRGIKYTEQRKHNCLLNCLFLDPEPLLTSDGDSTVVVPSAEANDDAETYYLNLKQFNNDNRIIVKVKHANVLEAENLLSFIGEIIQNNDLLPQYISFDKPIFDPEEDKPTLRLKIHSPVSIDIYDADGRHTGVVSAYGEDKLIEEQIPNSYYIEMGEGKYAGADILGTTTIKLVGQDFGTFTLDIEKVAGDNLIATTTFTDIPVAENSIALLEATTDENMPIMLKLDIDGDGEADSVIAPGEGLTERELIGILRGFVKTLGLPEKKEKQLLKKIEKLEKVIEKEFKNEHKKKQKTDKALSELSSVVDRFQKKGLLTLEEATELKTLIGRISGEVVE